MDTDLADSVNPNQGAVGLVGGSAIRTVAGVLDVDRFRFGEVRAIGAERGGHDRGWMAAPVDGHVGRVG